jgi:hypothetical protein
MAAMTNWKAVSNLTAVRKILLRALPMAARGIERRRKLVYPEILSYPA